MPLKSCAVVAHAGEGTLEAQLVRLQLRSMAENDGLFDFDKFLQKYVTFMTTPGSHNDTYAGVSAPTAGPTLVWVEAFCTADTPPPTLRLLSHGFLIMCVCDTRRATACSSPTGVPARTPRSARTTTGTT